MQKSNIVTNLVQLLIVIYKFDNSFWGISKNQTFNPPRCSTTIIPFHTIQDTKVQGGNSTAPKLFRHTKPLGGTCKETEPRNPKICLPGLSIWVFPKMGVPQKGMVYNGKPY